MTATALQAPDRLGPTAFDLSSAVTDALSRVRDPELDEPITDLRFVTEVRIDENGLDGGRVEVDLRLPTYFCAPNFAYLMVADAYDEIRVLPGVSSVSVRLLEHFASDEINAGVSAGAGFTGAFEGEAESELDELRRTFQRKAHRACQERVASALVRSGRDAGSLWSATLAEAAPGPDLTRLLRRRVELGLPTGPTAALLVHDDGTPITAADLPLQLKLARATRVSIEGNSTFCRGLLSVRYGLPGQAELVSAR